jgi:hypothetical protein
MNENSSLPMQTTSSPSDELDTPEQVRGNVLPRTLLTRSLVRHMLHRLRHAQEQEAYTRGEVPPGRVHAWVAAISTTWALIENTLKLYETIAGQVDTRSDQERKSLQWRFMRERDPAEGVTFHSRLWLFEQLDLIGEEVFNAAGIDPAEGRALLRDMVGRSLAYLRASEKQMRDFYRKYRPIVNAYKHGRALFAFVPIETATGFTLKASDTGLTALVPKKPGRGRSTRLVTFTADVEVENELHEVLALLDTQVPHLVTFFESFADTAVAYLAYLEGKPPDQLPVLQFSLFAEPYSQRETEVLEGIRGARLRLPEQQRGASEPETKPVEES